MKLQPRHFIAAPFLALSGFMVFSFFQALVRVIHKDWTHIVFLIAMSSVMILVPGVPGILALKRRWAEFVQIVAFFVLLIVSGLLMHQTNDLNKAIESLAPSRTSFPYIAWGLCVTVAPLVICITAYKRLVPLILRRIARTQAKSDTSHFPNL